MPAHIRSVGTLLAISILSAPWPTSSQQTEHYTRFRDAKWYARQLESLRDKLAKIDRDITTLAEARKTGKDATDAVALDQEPEGVNPEGQIWVLKRGRLSLLRQIDDLEEQARHNEIAPGELRKEYGPEDAETNNGKVSRAERDLLNLLEEEKEHLAHARKEADLLQRDQKLKTQQEYSKPEPRSRRNAELGDIHRRLQEKQAERQESEQRVADLEDRLEDLRRSQPETTAQDAENDSNDSKAARARDVKDEAYWRKQFAAIDYKIATAQTELDILQRELNMGYVQYYPNPNTAMKEGVTRREINELRKAIDDKRKEIRELKNERDELETALRHAGGPAGWSR